jgi:small subunit ribosomal protein S17
MSATPDTTAAAPAKGEPRKNRKTGKVISDKMEKTVVVEVTRLVKNERYGRYQKRSATFHADDRQFDCKVGDVVEIEETRPLSAKKRWRVKSVITRAKDSGAAPVKA